MFMISAYPAYFCDTREIREIWLVILGDCNLQNTDFSRKIKITPNWCIVEGVKTPVRKLKFCKNSVKIL